MRATAIALAAILLPPALAAEPLHEPTPEQQAAFDACMAEVDEEALDAHAAAMTERHAETTEAIDAACADGRLEEAAALHAPIWDEYAAHPEARKYLACIAELDRAMGLEPMESHVCDTE